MTLKLKHLPAVLGLTAALLALPSAAFAKGAFQFQSDQKHVAIQSMTSDGMGSFQMVLTFPVAVTEATTAQGAPCELNFRNDPKTIECHVPVAAGTPQPSSLDLMATIAEALGCDATIAHESSVDNRTYRDDGTIVRSGDCPAAPPPPPPEPTPQPGPDPNEQPAGGAVSKGTNPLITAPGSGLGPMVRLFDPPATSPFFEFNAFDPSFQGGVSVAQGDVNGDGVADVITGAGAGGGPHVKVFDGQTGGLLMSFFAFDAGDHNGIWVAAGDVNGDGKADIITGAGAGGGPHVKMFDGGTGAPVRDFMAFAPSFQGGVRVAAGDVNGDGTPDIITAAGPGGGPQVNVFDGKAGGAKIKSFFAEAPSFQGGVFVAAGDVNGDGFADIITGADAGGGPHVKVVDGKALGTLSSFFADEPSFKGGIRVAAGDVNGDGLADIITGAGAGGGPHVKTFSGPTGAPLSSFFAYDPAFTGGVFVADSTLTTPPLQGGTLPVPPSDIVLYDARCPQSVFGSCTGLLSFLLPAVQKIRDHKAGGSAAKVKKPIVIGATRFTAAKGKTVKVKVKISKKGRKAIGKAKKVKAFARIVMRDAAGNVVTKQTPVTLKFR